MFFLTTVMELQKINTFAKSSKNAEIASIFLYSSEHSTPWMQGI